MRKNYIHTYREFYKINNKAHAVDVKIQVTMGER